MKPKIKMHDLLRTNILYILFNTKPKSAGKKVLCNVFSPKSMMFMMHIQVACKHMKMVLTLNVIIESKFYIY